MAWVCGHDPVPVRFIEFRLRQSISRGRISLKTFFVLTPTKTLMILLERLL